MFLHSSDRITMDVTILAKKFQILQTIAQSFAGPYFLFASKYNLVLRFYKILYRVSTAILLILISIKCLNTEEEVKFIALSCFAVSDFNFYKKKIFF